MQERAARLPPVGACLGQALPPAHLGRVPAVLAVPVDLHLLARPRGSRYVRPSCYGLRCACVLTLRPACLWRSSSAQGTGRAASDAQEGQNHSPSGIRLSAGRRQRLRTPAYRVTDLRGNWRCVVAADEAHVPAGVAGVALEHLVRVVIPSAPDAAVVRLLLGAAAAHPALRSQRDLQVLGGAEADKLQ